MAFQLIKVEHLRFKQITRKPTIQFFKNGAISVNSTAGEMLGITDTAFLKILRDVDQLAIFISQDPEDAILLRLESKKNPTPRFIGQFRNLINFLIKELDWPLGDGLRNQIKYEIDESFEDPRFPDVKIFRLV